MLHTLDVPPEANDTRLDVWLESVLDGCTRSLVARLIRDGLCTVEGPAGARGERREMRSKPGLFLRGGERVSLEVPEIEPMSAEPEDLPLTILHEDEHLIAIDKAPGMVVHPAIGHPRGTLVNALLGRFGTTFAGEPWRPGLVHRLDVATSGVIVVARTPAALVFLQAAFKDREVGKRYFALVAGSPRADWLEHGGALGRHPHDFRKRAVLPDAAPGAKEAYTSVVVRHRGDGYAAVEARPRTGRTHQVRVHLADLGHPVLADPTYGRSDRWPLHAADDDARALRRHALHAWALDIPHPAGGRLRLLAPIPADLAAWVPAGLVPASA
jgi:23S rRNA pseudouridine1911/1915/1917 synthase